MKQTRRKGLLLEGDTTGLKNSRQKARSSRRIGNRLQYRSIKKCPQEYRWLHQRLCSHQDISNRHFTRHKVIQPRRPLINCDGENTVSASRQITGDLTWQKSTIRWGKIAFLNCHLSYWHTKFTVQQTQPTNEKRQDWHVRNRFSAYVDNNR